MNPVLRNPGILRVEHSQFTNEFGLGLAAKRALMLLIVPTATVDAFIRIYNDKAEPFVWTKKKVQQRRFKGRRITQL